MSIKYSNHVQRGIGGINHNRIVISPAYRRRRARLVAEGRRIERRAERLCGRLA